MTHSRHLPSLLTAAFLASTPALAQPDATAARIDPRWRAYLGCWSTSVAGVPAPDVCLLPTADPTTVEMVTVIGDSIGEATPLVATGQKVTRTKNGCTGWELARWSADDRRLYTTSEYSCAGGAPQRISGMLTHRGDSFSQIEGVQTRSATGVRVIRFDFISDSAGLPDTILRRLPTRLSTETWAARVEASAELTTADVLDASKEVGAPVTEAWLAERGQRFTLSARELRNLRDASVPTSVIDMMVAVSNPDVFTVAQGNTPGVRPQQVNDRRFTDAERRAMMRNGYGSGLYGMPLGMDPFYAIGDPYFPLWGLGPYGLYGNGLYGGFGFSRFGYGLLGYNSLYGNGFYNNGLYGNGFYGGGWYNNGGPYVIIPSPPVSQAPPGRAVNGRGYTQGASSGGGGASPRPQVQNGGGYSGGGSSSGGTSTSSGGGASAGASGGSSNSGGGARTAKPRP